MKRLIILIGLIGMLCNIPAAGFSQTKLKTKSIKYENGNRYKGETQIIKNTKSKKQRIKSGKGILYYMNGDVFEGTFLSDFPHMGVLRYVNGDVFEGTFFSDFPYWGELRYVNGDIFEGKWLRYGKLTFSSNGTINIGSDQWKYPAKSSFEGDIKFWSGAFDCILTNQKGDVFRGQLKDKKISSGRIDYANGDSFEGSFSYLSSGPKKGKYFYASATVVNGWKIPEGCTFIGDIAELTGNADKELIDGKGNKFSGKFKSGQPDEGTMTYAVTGRKETGKWVNGLSPAAYKQQQIEIKHRQDSIAKVTVANNLKKFESYLEKHQKIDWQGNKKEVQTIKELIPGGVLKLAQLFTKKEIMYRKETYLCDTVYYHQERKYPVLICTKDHTKAEFYVVEINKKALPYLKNLKCTSPSIEEDKPEFFVCKVITDFEHYSDWNFPEQLILASDVTKANKKIKDYYIQKFGYTHGTNVFNGNIKLGMTLEMVQAIHGKGKVIRQTFGGKEIAILQYDGGVYSIFGAVISSDSMSFTFINGRLTDYGSQEGGLLGW